MNQTEPESVPDPTRESGEPGERPPGCTEPPKVKTVSVSLTKKRKLALIAVILISLSLFLVWSFIPEKYYEVSDIAKDPGDFLGEDIQLTGVVANGSLDMKNNSFAVTDGKEILNITATGALPDTMKDGKDVMLRGELKREDGASGEGLENYYFKAEKVEVGCPSKYY